ncbi:hypothetical protein Pelo_70 [Pelomyxa schiedti]|nr:hypothetical protein Pelo_70 [Pelomyxa schiedti]
MSSNARDQAGVSERGAESCASNNGTPVADSPHDVAPSVSVSTSAPAAAARSTASSSAAQDDEAPPLPLKRQDQPRREDPATPKRARVTVTPHASDALDLRVRPRHVTALLPKYSNSQTATKSLYESVGQRLRGRGDAGLQALESAFLLAHSKVKEALDPYPFVFLCGSSGVGKTQLAFALKRTTIYVPLRSSGQFDQRIYGLFSSFSESLISCVNRDLENHKEMNWPWCAAQEEFDISLSKPCPITEIEGLFMDMHSSEVPCFFIDEADLKEQQHLFIRNALRACGASPILCGSNLNIANCSSSLLKTNTSTALEPLTWCLLVNKKSFTVLSSSITGAQPIFDALCHIPTVRDFLEYLITTSRPRIAHCIVKTLLELVNPSLSDPCHIPQTTKATSPTNGLAFNVIEVSDFLNILCDALFKFIWNTKASIYLTLEGRIAQMALFCAACHLNSTTANNTPPEDVSQQFVSGHFAHLHLQEGVHRIDLMTNGYLYLSEILDYPFNPTSYFPKPDAELWIHLCLLGTKSWAPLYNEAKRATTVRSAFYDVTHTKGGLFAIGNINAQTSSGNYLEQAASIAACVASRGLGFTKEGLSANDFLGFFLRHLLPPPPSESHNKPPVKIEIANRLEEFCPCLAHSSSSKVRDPPTPSFTGVGVMPPPNLTWPPNFLVLQDLGLKLSTLERVADALRVDSVIDNGFITIECKNKVVDTRDLCDILDRIKEHTHGVCQTAIVRAVVLDSNATRAELRPEPLFPNPKPDHTDRLLVLLEVGDMEAVNGCPDGE